MKKGKPGQDAACVAAVFEKQFAASLKYVPSDPEGFQEWVIQRQRLLHAKMSWGEKFWDEETAKQVLRVMKAHSETVRAIAQERTSSVRASADDMMSAKHSEKGKRPELILSRLVRFFDLLTPDDLELILADLAYDRRRQRQTGVPPWRIDLNILVGIVRTLFGVCKEKLKDQLQPLLKWWTG